MAFGEEYESGTECNSDADCHKTNEYCGPYTSKCHQCVDICVTDITKFDECTQHCKNYLRENVVRRLDDIENIYTLVCIIIVITSIILILLTNWTSLLLVTRCLEGIIIKEQQSVFYWG